VKTFIKTYNLPLVAIAAAITITLITFVPVGMQLNIGHAADTTYIVNNDGDGTDEDTGDNICEVTDGVGDCTLRAAIAQADATAGADTITFDSGMTITPGSQLPSIDEQVTIDGTRGAGCDGALYDVIIDGSLADAGVDGIWFGDNSTNSIVKGLVVHSFPDYGIYVQSSSTSVLCNRIGTNAAGTSALGNLRGLFMQTGDSGILVGGSGAGEGNLISGNTNSGVYDWASGTIYKGNIIGLSASGDADLGNGSDGITSVGSSHVIGGPDAADRNIISGNQSWGITARAGSVIQGNYIGTNKDGDAAIKNNSGGITVSYASITIGGDEAGEGNLISGHAGKPGINFNGTGVANVVVQGNVIGLNAAQDAALGNREGMVIRNVTSITIGGTSAGEANVISGNTEEAFEIKGTSTGLTIAGNYIGTTSSDDDLGNGTHGIYMFETASNNTIGGITAAHGNVIANNGGDGIFLSASGNTGNSILSNTMYDNTGLGIDLGANGVTANDYDIDDDDTGANLLQNFPVITDAGVAGGDIYLDGTLDTDGTDQDYTVQFFYSDAEDVSGYGEAENYIGQTTVTTDESGDATFTSVTIASSAGIGDYITATATNDSTGDTSELSLNFVAVEGDVTAPVVTEITPVSTPTSDITPSYTFNTDEVGITSYGGGCSAADTSAELGNNTIIFDALGEGVHSNCTITVTDIATNASNVLAVTAFTVDIADPIGALTLDAAYITLDDLIQTVAVTYDEIMDTGFTPSIGFSGNSGGLISDGDGAWSVSDTVWTETFTFDGTEEGAVVTVSSAGGRDLAGNTEGSSVDASFEITTILNRGGGSSGKSSRIKSFQNVHGSAKGVEAAKKMITLEDNEVVVEGLLELEGLEGIELLEELGDLEMLENIFELEGTEEIEWLKELEGLEGIELLEELQKIEGLKEKLDELLEELKKESMRGGGNIADDSGSGGSTSFTADNFDVSKFLERLSITTPGGENRSFDEEHIQIERRGDRYIVSFEDGGDANGEFDYNDVTLEVWTKRDKVNLRIKSVHAGWHYPILLDSEELLEDVHGNIGEKVIIGE